MSEAKAGGPRVFLSTALTADQTAFNAILPEIADTTGHAAVLAAWRAATSNWVELPEVDDNCTISYVEDVEDIWPLADLLRTSDVVTRKGVEQIAFGYPRRDLAEIQRFIASSAALTPVSAGSSQVAGNSLTSGSGMKAQTYHHLALLFQEDATNFMTKIFMKVRAVGAIEMTFGHEVTRIPAVFKVFAHSGFALGSNIEQSFQMTGPKSA